MNTVVKQLTISVFVLSLASCGPVEDPTLFPEFDASSAEPPPPKPSLTHTAKRHLLWGDLHIHTSYSTDAYMLGVTATPEDAYVFARGGTIEHAVGFPIRIDRPLDFAAVIDHSEYMGVARADEAMNLTLEKRSLRERLLSDGPLALSYALLNVVRNVSGLDLYANSPQAQSVALDAW